uniref:Dihydrolipoamide acetyl transferase n=1 Tax=Zea mays TaxID=4577 RepID=Q41737_MAIZE|nr:dihydrolipoamide acetyl transferase [Zea mays]
MLISLTFIHCQGNGRSWLIRREQSSCSPHEYNSGTFTLSNLGMFGVDRFDAILPPGTGAIMAVGASEPTVVGTKDGRNRTSRAKCR